MQSRLIANGGNWKTGSTASGVSSFERLRTFALTGVLFSLLMSSILEHLCSMGMRIFLDNRE